MVNTLLCQNDCALQTTVHVSFLSPFLKHIFLQILEDSFLPSYIGQSAFSCHCFSEVNTELLLTMGPSIKIWPDGRIWISVSWVMLSACTKMSKWSSACFGYLTFFLWGLSTLESKMKVTHRALLQES